MAIKYEVPQSFAEEHGFKSGGEAARVRAFTKIRRCYNRKGYHIGIAFNDSYASSAHFTFDVTGEWKDGGVDNRQISLSAEGQNSTVWVCSIIDLKVEDPNTKMLIKCKGMTDIELAQTLYNCLGDAIDIKESPTTSGNEMPDDINMADQIDMVVPGTPQVIEMITHPMLLKSMKLGGFFSGLWKGIKTGIAHIGRRVIGLITGKPVVVTERTIFHDIADDIVDTGVEILREYMDDKETAKKEPEAPNPALKKAIEDKTATEADDLYNTLCAYRIAKCPDLTDANLRTKVVLPGNKIRVLNWITKADWDKMTQEEKKKASTPWIILKSVKDDGGPSKGVIAMADKAKLNGRIHKSYAKELMSKGLGLPEGVFGVWGTEADDEPIDICETFAEVFGDSTNYEPIEGSGDKSQPGDGSATGGVGPFPTDYYPVRFTSDTDTSTILFTMTFGVSKQSKFCYLNKLQQNAVGFQFEQGKVYISKSDDFNTIKNAGYNLDQLDGIGYIGGKDSSGTVLPNGMLQIYRGADLEIVVRALDCATTFVMTDINNFFCQGLLNRPYAEKDVVPDPPAPTPVVVEPVVLSAQYQAYDMFSVCVLGARKAELDCFISPTLDMDPNNIMEPTAVRENTGRTYFDFMPSEQSNNKFYDQARVYYAIRFKGTGTSYVAAGECTKNVEIQRIQLQSTWLQFFNTLKVDELKQLPSEVWLYVQPKAYNGQLILFTSDSSAVWFGRLSPSSAGWSTSAWYFRPSLIASR